MRLPIWYVLASDGERLHRDLAIISASVLRHVDARVEIGLLCDQQSADAADRDGLRLESFFDHVVRRQTTETTALERSRALKLRMRLELSGDLVYVDSDTLALGPLDDWPKVDASVMLAYDYHPGQRSHQGAPDGAILHLQKIGWPTPVPRYFNGGVIVWRDDDRAHQFASAWYENWQYSVNAGVSLDQPALAHTDRQLGSPVHVLPPMFNAQISAWAGFAPDARLWHFWLSQVSDPESPSSILEYLLHTYQQTGAIDVERFERCRANSFPWVRSQGFKQYWLTGNYGSALSELPRVASRFISRLGSLPESRP